MLQLKHKPRSKTVVFSHGHIVSAVENFKDGIEDSTEKGGRQALKRKIQGFASSSWNLLHIAMF